ncbi:DUF4268 domain-containing protein [Candidatus Poribacteria bacterium]|nr:DUF4268 domain-containing protein [Candidatus Poribacteria bacterium]
MIGKIERVPLREIWKHEAHDFTKWLQDNLDVLNDVLDLSLSNAEREKSAGNFNVDLVAEDEAGNPVIIENQLEKSNHEHLGKIITYLTAVEAKTAIWIVSNPRPEHVSAIAWLNDSSSARFYLLKVEGIKIGNSAPAPLLTLIVGPSEEASGVGDTKKGIVERYTIRYRFWKELLEKARLKTKLHASLSPGQYGWISAGAGKSGISYNYSIRQHEVQVELYIDRGKDAEEENKKIFDELYEKKDEIEKSFGEPLNWERLNNRRACRISKRIEIGGYRDEEKYQEIQAAMIDAMCRLENAMKTHIVRLQI